MSPEAPAEPTGPAERVGGGGLAILPQLVSSPARAFERLREDPRWLGTCLLVIAMIAMATWIRLPQDLHYAEEGMLAGMERFGMSDEDIDEALSSLPDPEALSTGEAVRQTLQSLVGVVPFLFLASFVLHWMARLAGHEPRLRESLTLYWTSATAGAVGAILLAGLVSTQDTVAVSLSPAALTGLAHGSLPYLFLEIFDLFSVFTLLLLVTGVRVMFGVSSGAAWVLGGGFWALGSLFRFGTLALFSWFSGSL